MGSDWRRNRDQWKKIAQKLHRQFAYPGKKRLKKLILEGLGDEKKEESKEFCKKIDKVTEECKICQKYKINPSKPVVGFSMSRKLNEILTMDVGEFEKQKFVVMVDHYSWYTQVEWIKNKQLDEVIKALMKKWISAFETPKKFLTKKP